MFRCAVTACKLGDPNAPHIIKTERGVGYVFAIPVEQSRWAD
jgi:hypothetical protein